MEKQMKNVIHVEIPLFYFFFSFFVAFAIERSMHHLVSVYSVKFGVFIEFGMKHEFCAVTLAKTKEKSIPDKMATSV